MSFEIDANILLYASDSRSQYYEKRISFLEKCMDDNEVLYLGWPTIMSYLRIATHPSIFVHPLTPDEAMTNVETLLDLPHSRFCRKKTAFGNFIAKSREVFPTRANLVPDARLAAILRRLGINRIYTPDPDFLKFHFLDVRDPLV